MENYTALTRCSRTRSALRSARGGPRGSGWPTCGECWVQPSRWHSWLLHKQFRKIECKIYFYTQCIFLSGLRERKKSFLFWREYFILHSNLGRWCMICHVFHQTIYSISDETHFSCLTNLSTLANIWYLSVVRQKAHHHETSVGQLLYKVSDNLTSLYRQFFSVTKIKLKKEF